MPRHNLRPRKKGEMWQHGIHHNPSNWVEGAEALKSVLKGQRKPNTLMDRLNNIETALKEKK